MKGGDTWVVVMNLRGTSTNINPSNIVDMGDGTYQVYYTAAISGIYDVTVTVEGNTGLIGNILVN